MEYFFIPLTALLASGLTLFSGFGLGTILMPVFAVFFPVEVAVALTAIVHFLNNLFKLWLVGRQAKRIIIIQFGLPAMVAAILGAMALHRLEGLSDWGRYHLGSREFHMTPIKVIMAVLIMAFVVLELSSRWRKLAFDRRHLLWGGLLSGFFGGLSGHQGALRSAFLIKWGLTKEEFISTGVVIACLVDVARMFVYAHNFPSIEWKLQTPLLSLSVLAAFLGAWIGNQLVKKVTLRWIHILVSFLLSVIALGLGFGLI